MFLMIDNYDSFTYNLVALFTECGAKLDVIKNNEYVDAAKYSGIIISPGPSSPEQAGTSIDYLKNYLGKKPIFGVCLGMQSLGHVLGYKIKRAPTIQHGKVDVVEQMGKSVLYKGLPPKFKCVRYHSLVVDLPTGDPLITSRSTLDQAVMSLESPERRFFGVQYHPESILSEYGSEMVKNFLTFAAGSK